MSALAQLRPEGVARDLRLKVSPLAIFRSISLVCLYLYVCWGQTLPTQNNAANAGDNCMGHGE